MKQRTDRSVVDYRRATPRDATVARPGTRHAGDALVDDDFLREYFATPCPMTCGRATR